MKRVIYQYPKSSFLSVEKDTDIILDLMLKNENLKKLLYYSTKDCLKKPNLTEEQTYSLLGNNICMVPKLTISDIEACRIIITFDDFTPNYSNPEFRNNTISFDIFCHFSSWTLEDLELRPYRVAAEIDSMLATQKLTGVGKIEFLGATQLNVNSDLGGVSLIYQVIHGEEDNLGTLNPQTQPKLDENFDEMFNQ